MNYLSPSRLLRATLTIDAAASGTLALIQLLAPYAIAQFAGLAALTGPKDDVAKMCKAFDERRRFASRCRRGERGDTDREASGGAPSRDFDERAARQAAGKELIERGDFRRERIARGAR